MIKSFKKMVESDKEKEKEWNKKTKVIKKMKNKGLFFLVSHAS